VLVLVVVVEVLLEVVVEVVVGTEKVTTSLGALAPSADWKVSHDSSLLLHEGALSALSFSNMKANLEIPVLSMAAIPDALKVQVSY